MVCRGGEDDVGLAGEDPADDGVRGALGIHAHEGQRCGGREPGVLALTVTVELGGGVRTGAHQTRRDDAGRDAAAGERGRQALRETDRGELGRRVGQQVWRAQHDADRGDDCEAAALPLAHTRDHGVREVDGPPRHDVHRVFHVPTRRVLGRAHLDDACHMDCHVDRADGGLDVFAAPTTLRASEASITAVWTNVSGTPWRVIQRAAASSVS